MDEGTDLVYSRKEGELSAELIGEYMSSEGGCANVSSYIPVIESLSYPCAHHQLCLPDYLDPSV